ncbi:MAG: hypothetical protein EOM50_23705 [Erysipelotrichia bacterium]|nr:hypothetical protein [Erysipelotrichia bacterium]
MNLAKKAHYSSIFTSTSLGQNLDAKKLDQSFNTDTMKLSIYGGSLSDFSNLFTNAFSSGNKIDYVFWGIDIGMFVSDPSNSRFTTDLMFQTNSFNNSLSYLMNKQVLEYSIQLLKNNSESNYSFDDSYVWHSLKFGKDIALKSYNRGELSQYPHSYTLLNNLDNTTEIVTNLISEHPQTTFILYFTPCSILYWDSINNADYLDDYITSLKIASSRLLQYDNVELFSFSTDLNIITDLDEYRDWVHHTSTIDNIVISSLESGSNRITKNNYDLVFDTFKTNFLNFDFSVYYPNEK